jgi:hypothetical protein
MTNNPFAPKPTRYLKKALKGVKLGDKVHSVAQPIAKVIDRVIGTEIEKCGACAKRREKLNNLFEEK